jgi:hypothetical protein
LFNFKAVALFQTAGVLQYVEDLKRDTNAEIGQIDNFGTVSKAGGDNSNDQTGQKNNQRNQGGPEQMQRVPRL